MNRRFTQDNIDLNRNVIFDATKWQQISQLDYTAEAQIGNVNMTYMPNKEHNKVRWFLNNGAMPNFWNDDIMFWVHSASQILKYGYTAMSKVIVTGQYYDPTGIFFGGQQLAPEHEILKYFLISSKKSTSSIKGLRLQDVCGRSFEDFTKISLLDVHTGLGKPGLDTLLTSYVEDHNKVQELFKNDAAYMNNDRIMCACITSGSGSGFSHSGMYAHTIGTMDEYNQKFFIGKNRDTLSLTQEFGTVPGVRVFKALRNENMAHWYCKNHQDDISKSTKYKKQLEKKKSSCTTGILL